MSFFNNKTKKVLAGFLAFVIILPSAATAVPRNVEAGWISLDDVQGFKDAALDSITTVALRITINRFALRLVSWMRGEGFMPPGGPEAVLADIANQTSSAFIDELGLGFLCDQWSFDIQLAIQIQKPYRVEMECTLEDVVENARAFEDDFQQGGWDGFITMTVTESNNPFSAYIAAESELLRRVTEGQNRVKRELNYGEGILSFTQEGECTRTAQNPRTGEESCVEKAPDRTVTPGVLMAQGLKKATDLPFDQAVVADEMDGAINIVLGEMVSQVMGGAEGVAGIGSNPEGPVSSQLDTIEDALDEEFREILGAEALEIIESMRSQINRGGLLTNAQTQITAAREMITSTSTSEAELAYDTLTEALSETRSAFSSFNDMEATVEESARQLLERTQSDRNSMRNSVEQAKRNIGFVRSQATELGEALGWGQGEGEDGEDVPVSQSSEYREYAGRLFLTENTTTRRSETLSVSITSSTATSGVSAIVSLNNTISALDEFESEARAADERLDGSGAQAILQEMGAILGELYNITSVGGSVAINIASDPAEGISDMAEIIAEAIAKALAGVLPGGGGGVNIGI